MIVAFNLAVKIAAAFLQVPDDAVRIAIPMVAPLPPVLTASEFRRRQVVNDALEEFWESLDGFGIDDEEKMLLDSNGNTNSTAEGEFNKDMKTPSTYGEITPLGARQLFDSMGILSTRAKTEEQNVNFVDLGSGAGRLVVQAYWEIPLLVRSTGIELSPSRHEAAIRAWDKLLNTGRAAELRSMLLSTYNKNDNVVVDNDTSRAFSADAICPKNEVQLLEGDLFGLDLSEATHVYVSSLCFPNDFMERLERKLFSPQDAPPKKLQCVASLREFPNMKPTRTEYVEMTWTKPMGHGCPVYVYNIGNPTRSNAGGPT